MIVLNEEETVPRSCSCCSVHVTVTWELGNQHIIILVTASHDLVLAICDHHCRHLIKVKEEDSRKSQVIVIWYCLIHLMTTTSLCSYAYFCFTTTWLRSGVLIPITVANWIINAFLCWWNVYNYIFIQVNFHSEYKIIP